MATLSGLVSGYLLTAGALMWIWASAACACESDPAQIRDRQETVVKQGFTDKEVCFNLAPPLRPQAFSELARFSIYLPRDMRARSEQANEAGAQ